MHINIISNYSETFQVICTFIACDSKPIKQSTRQKDSIDLENFNPSAREEERVHANQKEKNKTCTVYFS